MSRVTVARCDGERFPIQGKDDTVSSGIIAALSGDKIDQDAYVEREFLGALVRGRMQCEISGRLLDIRTTVALMLYDGEAPDAFRSVVLDCMAYERGGGAKLASDMVERLRPLRPATRVVVIDGRDWTSKGVLSVKARARREAAQG